MHTASFTDLSIVIAIGVLISLAIRMIRQPMIIGYILTGIIVGPTVLGIIKSTESIEIFAQFGIALLLLIVGLGLNPRVIKEVGRIAALIGIGKVVIATSIGYMVGKAMGYPDLASLYIGLALSFSSTIIILKLLSDKKEQNRLYGKISIGFLLVEDLIATLVLITTSASAKGGVHFDSFGLLLLKLGVLLIGLVIMRMVILPRMNRLIANSQEFLFLFAIGWGLGIATLFSWAGFSLETGALLAGISLASMPYAQEISSRLKPLRDFFIVLFFMSLGSHLELSQVATILPRAIFLSALVLVGNPLIVMTIMGLSGYTKKTSFKAGIAGAQISEFSFIMLLLANQYGQVSAEVVSMITLVALITIAVSSYVIIYSDQIYNVLERYLTLFERKKIHGDHEKREHFELALFGYHKGGREFLDVFLQLKKSYVVVDYDPDVIDVLETKEYRYVYGDATDLELLSEINLDTSKLVVSMITDFPTNQFLANWLAKHNPHAVYICTADTIEQSAELYSLGVSYVILPHFLGTEKISHFIKRSGLKKSQFKEYREKHLAYLQTHYEEFGQAQAAQEEAAESV
jgi:Kef-type K+ transport system membrane component KefB/Trk K+ transport system NAD-binding subunit